MAKFMAQNRDFLFVRKQTLVKMEKKKSETE